MPSHPIDMVCYVSLWGRPLFERGGMGLTKLSPNNFWAEETTRQWGLFILVRTELPQRSGVWFGEARTDGLIECLEAVGLQKLTSPLEQSRLTIIGIATWVKTGGPRRISRPSLPGHHSL